MEFDKTATTINLSVFSVSAVIGIGTAGVSGLGLAAMFTAVVSAVLGLGFTIAGKHATANTCWIFLAIWFLVGFSICSSGFFSSFNHG